MSKFLDIEVLNYAISNLIRQIDKTFLKKKVLFNVTPAYYRLFNSATDNPSDKLTVIANGLTPNIGEVTSDTVRFITKNPTVYAVGSEVVFIEEVMKPKFDNIIGLDKQELNDIKALTKNVNAMTNLLCIGYLATNIYIYKKIKKQNTQISELKKELEEIKAKGE